MNKSPLINKDNYDIKYNNFYENKGNFVRNDQYDTEEKINLEIDKNKIKNGNNRNNDSSQNLNIIFFEIKNIQKSKNNSPLKSRIR